MMPDPDNRCRCCYHEQMEEASNRRGMQPAGKIGLLGTRAYRFLAPRAPRFLFAVCPRHETPRYGQDTGLHSQKPDFASAGYFAGQSIRRRCNGTIAECTHDPAPAYNCSIKNPSASRAGCWTPARERQQARDLGWTQPRFRSRGAPADFFSGIPRQMDDPMVSADTRGTDPTVKCRGRVGSRLDCVSLPRAGS